MSRTLIHRQLDADRAVDGRFAAAHAAWSRPERLRIGWLLGYVALATVLFIKPLAALFVYAAHSDLNSYIPLVPLIAAYVIYSNPGSRTSAYRTAPGGALVSVAFGCAALVAAIRLAERISPNDFLALMTLAEQSASAGVGVAASGGAAAC